MDIQLQCSHAREEGCAQWVAVRLKVTVAVRLGHASRRVVIPATCISIGALEDSVDVIAARLRTAGLCVAERAERSRRPQFVAKVLVGDPSASQNAWQLEVFADLVGLLLPLQVVSEPEARGVVRFPGLLKLAVRRSAGDTDLGILDREAPCRSWHRRRSLERVRPWGEGR